LLWIWGPAQSHRWPITPTPSNITDATARYGQNKSKQQSSNRGLVFANLF
jgi:hypothetical protein